MARLIVWIIAIVVLLTVGVWLYIWRQSRPNVVEVPGTYVVKSHDAILGAIGFKQQSQHRDEIRWFFERMVVPAWTSLKVHNAGAVTRTESDIRRLEELGLSTVSRAFLETRGKHDSFEGFRLVTLQILDAEGVARELLELSRSNAYVRSILRQPGVRIVREVDQVFDHETTDKLDARTKASATIAKARDTDVQITFGAERNSAVKISDGSVVSYRLALLCWATDGTLHLRLDHPNSACPPGYSETLPDTVQMADGTKRPVDKRDADTTSDKTTVTTQEQRADEKVVPQPECPSIAGWWARETDGVRLLIQQKGCTIFADAPRGPFAHKFHGLYTDDHFQYTVNRTNNADGCKTAMYGNIEVLDADRIRVVVAATDGKCELPSNFWEDLTWRRTTAPEPAPAPPADATVQRSG